MYQHIDDILIGGDNQEADREVSSQVWEHVAFTGIGTSSCKCQGVSQEVKFLGVLW